MRIIIESSNDCGKSVQYYDLGYHGLFIEDTENQHIYRIGVDHEYCSGLTLSYICETKDFGKCKDLSTKMRPLLGFKN